MSGSAPRLEIGLRHLAHNNRLSQTHGGVYGRLYRSSRQQQLDVHIHIQQNAMEGLVDTGRGKLIPEVSVCCGGRK